MITPARTAEGMPTEIKWKNADVAMPILSTHEIAANEKSLEYFKDGGVIRHALTREEITKFIQANGVYFVKLFIPKRITGSQPAGSGGGGGASLTRPENAEPGGFARP